MEEFDIVLVHISSCGVGDRTGVVENMTTKSIFDCGF